MVVTPSVEGPFKELSEPLVTKSLMSLNQRNGEHAASKDDDCGVNDPFRHYIVDDVPSQRESMGGLI